jgi:response regulator of citrate/malate metabolism
VTRPPIRTLVVAHDPMRARLHSDYLRRTAGFAVSGVVGTGQEALWRAGAGQCELVLLDFSLPDASGLDVCRSLRLRAKPIDVIALTSARDAATMHAALSYGVVHYLLKPFSFATFRDRLEQYSQFRELIAAGTGDISQRDIDRALAALRPEVAPAAAQPKGFSPETLEATIGYLRSAAELAEPVTAEEVATAIGVARVTARRYLERLADESLVARSLRYGSSGRPRTLYQWRTLPPLG